MSLRTLRPFVFALACLGTAWTASAQVIQPPPRSTGGLFGGGRPADSDATQHAVGLTLNLLGGQDDNVLPNGEGVPTNPLAPAQSSTTGTLGSDLNYLLTRGSSSLEAAVHGQFDTFRDIDVGPLLSGSGRLRGTSNIGSKTILLGEVHLEYRPTFTWVGFESGPSIAAASVDPTTGLLEIRSLNSGGIGSTEYRWTQRHRTAISTSFASNQYVDDGGFDSRVVDVELRHIWNMSRSFALRAAGSRSHQVSLDQRQGERPLDSDSLSLGIEVNRRLSRTRVLQVQLAPSIANVRTVSIVDRRPLEYVAPGGIATVSLDLGRTWAVTADWQREVTLIEELTAQSFLTTTSSFWFGGNVGTRWLVSALGAYTSGAPHRGDTGSFKSSRAVIQAQYRVLRWTSLVGSYSFGRHQLRDVSGIPAGFPSRFARNAIRVGVTVSLPLYGTFPAATRPGSRRR